MFKVEIWIGDVPKGQEIDIKKAYFMKFGEVAMESNKDNEYIVRQIQSIEITKHVVNAKHDDTENVFRSAKELDHVPSHL